MTTICTDGIVMAADSRACTNDTIACDKVMKLARLVDGSVLGISGMATIDDRLARWIMGEGEFPKDCGDWSALHLTSEGVTFYSKAHETSPRPVDCPAAIGSGREFAIGAMLAGAGPVKAVEIAAMRDPFTGGPIKAMKVGCSDGT
jgi:ATP-dependent protease HslVU (ClpYQ) peptidase subunit